MRSESARNSPSYSKSIPGSTFVFLALIGAIVFSEPAPGQNDSFSFLQDKASKESSDRKTAGWSYIVGGSIALGVSIPGYYVSDDNFAKGVYSIAQTLGVGSIGYGAHLLTISGSYSDFISMVDETPNLTRSQKNSLATSFIRRRASHQSRGRSIRVISHSLVAALNLSNAVTAKHRDLKSALYFIGGVNVLAAFYFALSKSEEEKSLESALLNTKVGLSPAGAVIVGVTFP